MTWFRPAQVRVYVMIVVLSALAAASLWPTALHSEDRAEQDYFGTGPNVGRASPLIAPIDVYWDEQTKRLYARSLILVEIGDAVDLRIRRAPGEYPDGPISGTSPAGEVPGGIHWDVLTDNGWRQISGIEGVGKDRPAPPPTSASHPGWLSIYTYPENYDERVRRVLIDDKGAMSIGGGGYGGEGLSPPRHGIHVFGGGLRVQSVEPPEMPRLSLVGTGGEVEYAFQIVARDSQGNESAPSAPAMIRGPRRLTAAEGIRIQWDKCPGAETYYILRNRERLDVEFRGEGNEKTFVDAGIAAVAYEPVNRNGTADAQIDGALTINHGLHTPGTCRPPALLSDTHDYNPPRLHSATTLVVSADNAVRLTGIDAPESDGRWLIVLCDGTAPVTLVNESEESDEKNRIRTGRRRDLVLDPDATVCLVYTVGRWRVLGPTVK